MLPSFTKNRHRRGAVVVLVALLLMFVVLTVVALDIDGGILLDARRHAQATADAGALAGAAEIYRLWGTYQGVGFPGASDAALACTTQNGYPNSGSTRVQVFQYPDNFADGPRAGSQIPRGCIEVIVERDQERYFSGIVGSGTLLVRARAVARGKSEPSGDGIIVLDLQENRALNAHGNGSITVTGTGKIIVNSKDGTAGYAGNNSVMFSSAGYHITGGVNDPSRFQGGEVTFDTNPVIDPLRFLPQPDKSELSAGSHTTTTAVTGSGKTRTKTTTHYYTAGFYTGGIKITHDDPVIFGPGIYYMDGGGFEWSGKGSLTAAGVMVYNDPGGMNDKISLTGQGAVTWTPPSSGVYKGISIFQNRAADVTAKIAGNGQMNITGLFYAPNALMMVEGNGDASVGSQYISRTLDVGGNGSLTIDYNALQPPPTRVLQLVE